MRLTEEQLRFFDTFGFLKFPGLFAPEADKIIERFEKIWADHGGGHFGRPHDHDRRTALIQFIDRDEYLSSLIDDPRLDEMVSSLLGDDYNYTGSDGNYYVGDTRWHSDARWHSDDRGSRPRKYMSMKLALYLDPVTRDTGCLRVIPGSHREGDIYADALQEMVRVSGGTHDRSPCEELWGIAGSEVPAVALETYPGDVAMFNHKTKHSSWGGDDRRRMFTINYEQRYNEEDLDELKESMGKETRFWIERNYGDTIVNTAGPGRMRHLEQRLANDGHMQEMARKARSEMEEPSRG